MEKNKAQISILGCGWLGFPLAEKLIEEGYPVKGSTTSQSKMEVLNDAGITPYIIALSGMDTPLYEAETNANSTEFLKDSKILIIDIPPKLRGNTSDNFVKKIKSILPFIEQSSVEKVLFVSSTSVYADDNSVVTEQSIPQPDTEGAKQLLEAERLLQGNSNFKTTILRFGGLIGEDRHPIKQLAGRENLENPYGIVNLIHQTDCIGIIAKIIGENYWGELLNAVAPFHPTRSDYYTEKARKLNLPLPKFSFEKASAGKTISSEKVEKSLQYQFNLNVF